MKHTIDLVSKLNGNVPCKPIDPNLACSTDDNTTLAHKGKQENNSE